MVERAAASLEVGSFAACTGSAVRRGSLEGRVRVRRACAKRAARDAATRDDDRERAPSLAYARPARGRPARAAAAHRGAVRAARTARLWRRRIANDASALCTQIADGAR